MRGKGGETTCNRNLDGYELSRQEIMSSLTPSLYMPSSVLASGVLTVTVDTTCLFCKFLICSMTLKEWSNIKLFIV